MGSFSFAHWLIVALVVLILFGRGRISETMGEFGRGLRSFRKGISEEESVHGSYTSTQQLPPQSTPSVCHVDVDVDRT